MENEMKSTGWDAITELCDLNFNDYYTRIYMSLALLIHDYYAI